MQYEYRKSCSTKEFYYLIDDAFKSMKDYRRAMKEKLIEKAFEEKIMLAVTDINGCELCNAFHTQNAKKFGVSQIEIGNIISGGIKIGTTKEDIALDFAKHYALENGDYSDVKWNKLIEAYGEETAKGILGVIRIIMMGNAYGIAAGALLNRFKLKPVKRSTLFNELSITLNVILFVPFLGIKRGLLKA
ncbi:MAG: carboxymuconolactone decarboxylase family protein [Bacillota bacterium]|nr:carboxymuconolactone decarboxylase family protein [Bacillota bacterium]